MASPEGKRSPSPLKDGFLFKGYAAEELERLTKHTSPRPNTATSRPKSGTTRPSSGTSRPSSAATSAGFQQYLDYSKINNDRSNLTKADTFKTPTGLDDKNFNHAVRVSKRDLYDICEQSFRKSVHLFAQEILQDVKQELAESMELTRREQSEALEERSARDSTMSVMMKQIHETVLERHCDFNKVQKEIRNGEMLVLEGQRDMILRLEGKLLQNIGQVRNELQDVRRAQEEAEEEFREFARRDTASAEASAETLGRRTVEQLALVESSQKSLNAICLENSQKIQTLHEAQIKQLEHISRAVEDQLLKQINEGTLGNQQVMSVVRTLIAHTDNDFSQMLREIAKVQKALNVDFVQIMDDAITRASFAGRSSVLGAVSDESARQHGVFEIQQSQQTQLVAHPHQGVSRRQTKRMREYYTQTEQEDTKDAWMQTDKVPEKKHHKRLHLRKPPTSAAIAVPTKSQMQLAAEKAKDGKSMFADADAMRAKVRQAYIKPQYNVFDRYHNTGIFQAIGRSSLFESLTLVVICLNAVWIAVDIDFNTEPMLWKADPVFQVAENSFCAFFTGELLIRFFAFKCKRHCFQDFWFSFDFLLVALMILETWILNIVIFFLDSGSGPGLNLSILRIVRMAKMVRISRMVRLLRAIPEVVIVLKGLGQAARSVSVFFVLWLLIIYVFAVVFRQLTEGSNIGDSYFETVPVAMNTLLLDGILPDASPFVKEVSSGNPVLWPLIIFFILLAAVCLMYMLIGVLVDVVSVIASTEKEGMTVISLASQLRAAWEALGRDTEQPISKSCFQDLLCDPEIARISSDVHVDVMMLVDMTDVVFEAYEKENKDMMFEDFVELMLKMRGENAATVKDVREHLKVTRATVKTANEEMLRLLGEEFTSLKMQLHQQQAAMAKSLEAQRDMMAESSPSDSECSEG